MPFFQSTKIGLMPPFIVRRRRVVVRLRLRLGGMMGGTTSDEPVSQRVSFL